MNALEKKLIELLHTIAGYNDKGFVWYNHSHAESEELRLKWRAELDCLIAEIGEENFSPRLLERLYEPDAVQDSRAYTLKKRRNGFPETLRRRG